MDSEEARYEKSVEDSLEWSRMMLENAGLSEEGEEDEDFCLIDDKK